MYLGRYGVRPEVYDAKSQSAGVRLPEASDDSTGRAWWIRDLAAGLIGLSHAGRQDGDAEALRGESGDDVRRSSVERDAPGTRARFVEA